MKRELVQLGIEEVAVRSRVRQDPGDLSTLAASVAKLGLLVPVIVDRRNILICGARRLEACRRAGVARIPAVRLDIDYDSMAALDVQVDRTLCREPLAAQDLDRLIQRKKAMAGGSPPAAGGVRAGLRRFFRRASAD